MAPAATIYGPIVEVEFEVTRVWKGEISRAQVVVTSIGGSVCGFGFETGRAYLVYVSRNDYGLWVSLCSHTRQTDEDPGKVGLGPGSLPLDVSAPAPAPLPPGAAAREGSPEASGCQAGGRGVPSAAVTGVPLFLLLAWLGRRVRR
jgi:hypothetical protein